MKKAYFFIIDAIFAVVFLVIGYMLIITIQPRSETELPTAVTAENIMQFMSNTKVTDLCSDCTCDSVELSKQCSAGLIKNMNNSLLAYMGELYSRLESNQAELLFDDIVFENNMLNNNVYGISLSVEDQIVFEKPTGSSDSSSELVSVKRIIFGYYENPSDGNVDFWGPLVAEINVWVK